MKQRRLFCAAIVLAGMVTAHLAAAPVDGTFSYQGRLTSGGAPITGSTDARFSLWDSAAGGAQAGPTIDILGAVVADGLFNADLDFGVAALNGDMRWLQIEVRSPAGVGSYVNLGRQAVLGAPYAIQTRGLHVDSLLNVGIGTTAPAADLHVGDADPTLLLRDQSGANLSGLMFNPTGFYPIELLHPTDGNISAGVVDAPWGAQWQAFDREGGGFTGIVGAYGSTANSGDGFVELFSKEGGFLATAGLYSDGNNNTDTNEYGLLRLGSAGATGQGGAASIRNNDDAETISLLGGTSGNGGTLSFYQPTTGNLTLKIYGNDPSGGAGFYMYSENGFEQVGIEPDHDGSGVYVRLARLDQAFGSGLIFDGSYLGSGNASVSINGSARSVDLNMNNAGTDSVSLPTDAVQDTEILDEPGVASAAPGTTTALSGLYDNILTRTITCPTSGYCVVIGSVTPEASHTGGLQSLASFGVSDIPNSIPASQFDNDVDLPSSAPTGFYSLPTTVHGTFSVTAGSKTFYLVAKQWQGGWAVNEPSLTVLFVPTAYGTVARAGVFARGDKVAPELLGPPMSAGDVRAEQLEAVAFDQDRRAAEASDYAAQIAELQTQLQQVLREQESMRQELHRASPPPGASGATLAAPPGHNNAGSR